MVLCEAEQRFRLWNEWVEAAYPELLAEGGQESVRMVNDGREAVLSGGHVLFFQKSYAKGGECLGLERGITSAEDDALEIDLEESPL